jgi:serine/threonine-protein kinase
VVVGGPADTRSDVYGLGAVLYFLLCGRLPFEYSELNKLLMAHVAETPQRPSIKLGAPIDPEALEEIVMRCLEKEPSRRFASAAELSVALEAVLGFSSAGIQALTEALPPVRALGSQGWDTTEAQAHALALADDVYVDHTTEESFPAVSTLKMPPPASRTRRPS